MNNIPLKPFESFNETEGGGHSGEPRLSGAEGAPQVYQYLPISQAKGQSIFKHCRGSVLIAKSFQKSRRKAALFF